VSLAYLVSEEKVYFARHQDREFIPTSAIVRLIQGVYSTSPQTALSIIRNRIFSTAQASEMCHGMIKVAAKRLTDLVPEEAARTVIEGFSPAHQIDLSKALTALSAPLPFEQNLNARLPLLLSPSLNSENRWMELAKNLAAHTEETEHLPIAALLVSADNRILSAAINFNGQNKTLHAEVNLIQSFYRIHQKKLPPGSKIVTTLKPCKMCAGMIWSSAEDITSMKILFGEMDNGNHARETVLDRGTFERKRASRTPTELHCEIESQI
jgi:tRNA(Arg) A34 adenosine deaminase TadA